MKRLAILLSVGVLIAFVLVFSPKHSASAGSAMNKGVVASAATSSSGNVMVRGAPVVSEQYFLTACTLKTLYSTDVVAFGRARCYAGEHGTIGSTLMAYKNLKSNLARMVMFKGVGLSAVRC